MSQARFDQSLQDRFAPASYAGAGVAAPPPPARIRWIDPEGVEQQLPLTALITVGRSADNMVRLVGPAISRHHATFAPGAPGEYFITDLQSSNGTRVNDHPLAPNVAVALRGGDRVVIGETTITFEAPPPLVVAAPPAFDSTMSVALPKASSGWLELANGERRILGGETRIGRSAKNDITIEDALVSRNHAHIRRIDGRYVLSDLGSANGTRVNGADVLTPRELADGDTIQFGAATLRFVMTQLADTSGDLGSGVSLENLLPSETRLVDLLGGISAATVGELREVTILFADMHGFTAMSERLNNPEQTTYIINQVFEALTAEIVRYGGSIDKYGGDNIMAVFGAPIAHEDDPERAVKAALAMGRALTNFNRRLKQQLGLELQIRTGINTGEVLYGEVGGGGFRSYTVMGDPVNLASRLEHASRVGYITVGETTYDHARKSFVFIELAPMQIKGKRELVQAYEVVRERRPDEIVDQSSASDYLIGREAELAQLSATLQEVQSAHQGRLLAVVGDAGIGKSQLLTAFRRSEAAVGITWIVARCISYEAAASYALLGSVMRALLNLDSEEAVDRVKLNAAIVMALPGLNETTRSEYLALTGEVLGVRVNPASITGLEAKVRRKLLMTMVRALVTGKVFPGGREQGPESARPLAFVLEEMQWADSASVDALGELIDALPNVPVLLILTYRPEWSHSWTARSYYRQLNLAELTPEKSRLFLQKLLPGAALDDAIAASIIAQCGNNPLLLEETVRSLRDRNVLVSQGGQWVLTADISLLNMPSTLRGMMMARLDRLSDQDRSVLQKAAIVGRSFTYRLMALLTGLDEALDESVTRLKDGEFIIENPMAAEPEYSFKHAIIQEIAYNNVLAAERRVLHGQVGEALERICGDRVDDDLEMLAHHYGRSGNKRKAIEFLLRSGEKARRLYANAAAITQFEEALDKLRSMSPQEIAQDPLLAVRLHEALGDAYLVVTDFPRTQERYEAGLAVLAAAVIDRARLWHKLGRLWEYRGEGRKALGSYEQGMSVLSGALPSDLASLQAAAARAHCMLGEYERATALATVALAATVDATFDPLAINQRQAQADARHVLGVTAYAAGHPDEAFDQHLRALTLRQELGDTSGMQESYHELGSLSWSRGQLDRAFEHLVGVTTMLRLGSGDTDASRVGQQPGGDNRGFNGILPALGDAAGELAPIERYYRSGLAAALQLDDRWGIVTIANRVGTLLFQEGEYERALGYLRTAFTEAERIGAREVAAAASITLGAIQVVQGQGAVGLQYLERGVAMAEAVESAVTLAEGRLRLAEAKLALGDIDGAGQEEQQGFLLATRTGHQATLGLTHRIMGRTATARQNWVMADRHFRLAWDLYKGVDAQHEIGRTLVDFATMWRAWAAAGNGTVPEGATMMLQEAAQIFAHLDMQVDLRVAREALLVR